MTILDDGKILVAAIASDGGPGPFVLLRYTNDGMLDASYTLSGTLFVGYPGQAGMAVQADGKIVLGGCEVPNHMELARYNEDGTIDDSFGTNGLTGFLYGSGFSAVAMHGDNILASGDGVDMRIVQFDATGHMDQTFGTDGAQVFDFGGNETAVALLVQSDGKVVAGGSAPGVDADMALARCNADGSPDTVLARMGR